LPICPPSNRGDTSIPLRQVNLHLDAFTNLAHYATPDAVILDDAIGRRQRCVGARAQFKKSIQLFAGIPLRAVDAIANNIITYDLDATAELLAQ
jgi:hypothetical protein